MACAAELLWGVVCAAVLLRGVLIMLCDGMWFMYALHGYTIWCKNTANICLHKEKNNTMRVPCVARPPHTYGGVMLV